MFRGQIQLILSTFVEGHQMTFSTKLLTILFIGLGEDALKSFLRETGHDPGGHVY